MTLDQVLKHKTLKSQFVKHAKGEHNDENLMFLKAVPSKKYQQVYDLFVDEKAKYRVNISAVQCKAIKASLQEDFAGNKDKPWADAEAEIKNLVENDILPRFLKKITEGM